MEKATRESIVTELREAEWLVAKSYSTLDRAIAYRTRMAITLELMDRKSETN